MESGGKAAGRVRVTARKRGVYEGEWKGGLATTSCGMCGTAGHGGEGAIFFLHLFLGHRAFSFW